MPIVLSKEVKEVVRILVWKIEESTDELMLQMAEPDKKWLTDDLNENKKLETITTRILIRHLVTGSGLAYMGMNKDIYGKPHLVNQDRIGISISHAFPYCAAILDTTGSTGIDIESVRPQIDRIKHKFLSEQELTRSKDLDDLTVLWCAKECLYKIYGRKKLLFKSQLSIKKEPQGLLTGSIINVDNEPLAYSLQVEKFDGHYMVYKLP